MSGRIRAVGWIVLLMACAAWMSSVSHAAARPEGVDMVASIDGVDIANTTAGAPLRLDPGRTVQVLIDLTNNTGAPVQIRHVDLTGRVLGLEFFSYSTAVELTVAPGKPESLRYRLDLSGLDGQATGLIGSELAVVGADRQAIAATPLVADVRGSLRSVYGLFGIVLAVLTVFAIVDAALSIARHRLSANRWARGVRLLAPGIGIGLVFAFTASVARWWVPETGLWLSFAGVTAAVAFLLGYASPTPASELDEPEDDELDDLELAEADTVRFSGGGPITGGTARFPAGTERLPAEGFPDDQGFAGDAGRFPADGPRP
ncbi:hypothetical protein [Nocardia sp. NPDC052566]|uniref:hypothetical protein n=1 Tax=Nocardia sp. NPDC052566 TaxID=3364330 RepID=UPI0037C92EE4